MLDGRLPLSLGGSDEDAGLALDSCDLTPTQEDQFPQLGSRGIAGWGDEHHRLISKQGSLVLPRRQTTLQAAELWGRDEED